MARILRRLLYLLPAHDPEADLRERSNATARWRRTSSKRSGVPAADASAASRRALGNITLAREDARADLDLAIDRQRPAGRRLRLRSLRKNPGSRWR